MISDEKLLNKYTVMPILNFEIRQVEQSGIKGISPMEKNVAICF